MKTIAVANQKGGVGKTATSCHLCLSLAEQDFNVLYIDNDPQGNATYSLLKSELAKKAFMQTAEGETPIATIDMYKDIADLSIKPNSNITVMTADRNLSLVARYESEAPFIFKENLEKIASNFDYCIIDNPPTLGLGLIAALVSTDYVFTPIEIEDYSIQGLQDLQKTIQGVKQRHNTKLHNIGIIPNRMNSRDNEQKQKLVKLIQHFQTLIVKTPLVQRGSISKALSQGKPVWGIVKENSGARIAAKEMRRAMDYIESEMGLVKETSEH